MTKSNAIKAAAGAAILGALAYLGQSGNTGFEPSTGSTAVVLTEYASATPMPLFAAMMPETGGEPECPAGAPTISTPDGAVTCCSPSQIAHYPKVGQPQLIRRNYDCPAGWRVTVPGAEPGPQRVVEWNP